MGNAGRDLLIGGLGADRLIGNKDDDILIAARTAFDDDAATLVKIMHEWTSAGSFQNRVNNVWNGTRSLTGTGIKLQGNVIDDDSEDVLTGSQGDDWFLWNSVEDRATDLGDEVFASDLDWILSA